MSVSDPCVIPTDIRLPFFVFSLAFLCAYRIINSTLHFAI